MVCYQRLLPGLVHHGYSSWSLCIELSFEVGHGHNRERKILDADHMLQLCEPCD